jgi:predicted nuclease with TOPRIM domain
MQDEFTNQYDQKPTKRNLTWLYISIILLLLASNIYFFTQRKKEDTQIQLVQQQYQTSDSARAALQSEYNASLARLDDLTGKNATLDQQLKANASELAQAKSRIEQILKNQQATQQELAEAKGLIARLNGKISGYEREIARLKKENVILTTERDSVVSDIKALHESNEGLQEKVNLAKVLRASNIRITGVILGRRKEKETSKAKRVDVLRITFDIDENRVAESGMRAFNVRILNPSGSLLSNAALGSGSFLLAESGRTSYYSISKSVMLHTGQPLSDIKVDWQQSAQYEKGDYTIEIYNEGYLIGNATVQLR